MSESPYEYDENDYDEQEQEPLDRIRKARDSAIEKLKRAEVEIAKKDDINAALHERLKEAEQATAPQVRVVNPDASLDPNLIAHGEEEWNSDEGRRRARTVANLKLPDPTSGATVEDIVQAINASMAE